MGSLRESIRSKMEISWVDGLESLLKNSSCHKTIMTKHWRTRRHDRNREKLLPMARAIWLEEIAGKKQDPRNVHQRRVRELLKQAVWKNKIDLNHPSENLYARAVREADPRVYRGGIYMGLKPDFPQ